MIDYIVGISIAVFVLWIIIRGIQNMIKGEKSGCGCSCGSCVTPCSKKAD